MKNNEKGENNNNKIIKNVEKENGEHSLVITLKSIFHIVDTYANS